MPKELETGLINPYRARQAASMVALALFNVALGLSGELTFCD